MTRQLRIGSVVVQPVLVWDDGTELAPGPPIKALHLPLSEAREMLDQLPEQVAELAAQFAAGDDEDTPA